MASESIESMTSSLIDALNTDIYTIAHGGRPLDAKNMVERPTTTTSMYGVPNNPFVAGDDDEYVEEIVISPLSETDQPRSAWHPDTWAPENYSPVSAYDKHQSSPYAEDAEDSRNSVHFSSVNWQGPQENEEQEQEQPPSGDGDDGLGIHMVDGDRAIDEKRSWEPTEPPAAAYRPNTLCDFEDVELNKPNEKPGSCESKRKKAFTENNMRMLLWALVLLLPFVILPLAIFGGVFHFGHADGLCKAGGGTWNDDTHDCQY